MKVMHYMKRDLLRRVRYLVCRYLKWVRIADVQQFG